VEVDFVAQLTSYHDLGFSFGFGYRYERLAPAPCRNVENIDELIF
jgi:hypothetical protein